jgi:hypothetical protein
MVFQAFDKKKPDGSAAIHEPLIITAKEIERLTEVEQMIKD